MAIRKIRTDEDPVLRKKTRVVESFDEKIKELVNDMIETMYSADGVGLAAPQIGILKKIFVVDIYDGEGVKVLINPQIVSEEGEQYEIEGCLSLPGLAGKVKRPYTVTIKGFNENGDAVEYTGSDLLARAFCHENDHLDGILFTDKADMISEDDEE